MSKNKELTTILQKEEWYQNLIDDLKAIVVERTFNSEYEKILGKWEIGERILQDEDKGITKSLHRCAVDLNKGERDLWYCLEFCRKYPKFPKEVKKWGKEIKWVFIKKELTEPKETSKKQFISVLIDEKTMTIWIKEKYRKYKIKYK